LPGINLNCARLALALHKKLQAELPALIAEVNAQTDPALPELDEYQLVEPVSIELGVTNQLIRKEATELPAVACGVYTREPVEEHNETLTEVLYPYMIEVYISDPSPTGVYILGMKWQAVLDAFVERHLAETDLVRGIRSAESASMDITFALENQSEEIFKQVIGAVGVFQTTE
jgi:hypothetical protein